MSLSVSPRAQRRREQARLRVRRVVKTVLRTATVVGAVAVVATAFAYWTAQSSGSVAGTTPTMQTVTVAAYVGEPITSNLYPGGPAGDVMLKVTNPNAYAVTLYSIAGNGPITGVDGIGTCTTTGVTFTPPVSPNITIGAGPQTQVVTLPGAVSLDTTSDSGCQGATFHIPVTITVHT